MPILRITADGSHTMVSDSGILYHSHHGAIQESRHIFIEAGAKEAARIFPEDELSILEIGFGTGLNAFLTAIEAESIQRNIRYSTTELHPISETLAVSLNYPDTLGHAGIFDALHAAPWEDPVAITPRFSLRKLQLDAAAQELPSGPFHCIFFDAFAPEDQSELWTEVLFRSLFERAAGGGILTTYCAKGIVRRVMQAAGWSVEKLPGPTGKREIVRARKTF